MKINGKLVQVASLAPYEGMPPGVAVLTEGGRLFVTYDDKPPEEWVWTEVSLSVEES